MPMFHDPDRPWDGPTSTKEPADLPKPIVPMLERRTSEESIRTEFCEGPILDDLKAASPETDPVAESIAAPVETSDRAELIERLKRGESPTWVPNRKLEGYYNLPQRSQSPYLITRARNASPAALLPAIELRSVSPSPPNQEPAKSLQDEGFTPPSEGERPRSALHTGNFTEPIRSPQQQPQIFHMPANLQHRATSGPLRTSPTTPWFSPPSRLQDSFQNDSRFPSPKAVPIDTVKRQSRSRAPSLQSFSSSYLLKPPTSPLVQQSNNDDLDFSPINLSESPSKSNRRHTLPPQSLKSLNSLPNHYNSSQIPGARQPQSFRTEAFASYQKHQSRRSLTSNWSFQACSSPPTPAFLRSRRPSFSSEASPIQHASMVGSYEESILRGRMSTGPSKPLDFTAQIGVLGKGDCKPKYPPHVTVPFPAVYYSWNNGTGRNTSMVDDEPSPYVGHIDLEHSLPPKVEKESHRRHKEVSRADEHDANGDLESSHEHGCAAMNLALRKREKRKRRSPSPKAPLGGSYRIPQQGQLQIMIKNPNKTAVKLFLVPYDLTGMEASTKTFIRQRCYSAGPIIENPLTSNLSVTEPPTPLLDSKSKPALRYLIHLNICCPSKGRFYLHQHIRVVFANRVPDNKENLQTDIQLPEPRYSTYKANRDALPPAASSAGAKLAAEKAQRRRSYGFGIPTGLASFGVSDMDERNPRGGGGSSYPNTTSIQAPPVPPIPFSLRHPSTQSQQQLRADDLPGAYDPMDLDSSRPTSSSGVQSPLSDQTGRVANTLETSYRSSPGSASGGNMTGSTGGSVNGSEGYSKLNRGDAGYGGVFGRPGTPEPGEGLLARRLRGLGMEKGS
ncbi:hypothetical protein MMC30_002919 [Trapelia coarctata]|nr:hypothetical protein [Trapelia coarctata]